MQQQPLSVDLRGQTALVTGATRGIGKEIAAGLARLGAEVILGVRDVQAGEAVREQLIAASANKAISVLRVDLSSTASIRAFAEALKSKHQKLHVLVNNAGLWLTDRKESADGHELTFATNVLGPHLLTHLLLDVLKGSAPARVVNVVSSLAGNYDPSDLDYRRRTYDGFKAYGQSKQALRMLTWGLARRLEGTNVTVNAAAPGFVRTDFNRDARGLVASMINLSSRLFAVTPAEGADTPLWVAASPELKGKTGAYFDKRKEQDGKFREPGPIADLERACDVLTGIVSGPAQPTVRAQSPLTA